MHKTTLLFFIFIIPGIALFAQNHSSKKDAFVDITGTLGKSQTVTSASYVYNWRLGKREKWELGFGLRYSAYFGTKKYYITAPARLARGTTFPFLIVFAAQKTENWDTLTVQRPFTNSLNATFNLGYHITEHWYAGTNIDLIGVTVGRNSSAILTSNGTTTTEANAKPANFNLLLTGDNDLGTLNSEFFLRYDLNNRWSLKGTYQFFFSEYKTRSIQQIAPDGTSVDRFRNKVNAFGLGISYHIN